jgi:prevent-host-death family protein
MSPKSNEFHQQNRVGIRELRLDTSKILSRVIEGEEFLVTDRGEPVAQLIPIHKDSDDFFVQMVESGEIIPAQNPNYRFKAPTVTHKDKKTLSEKLVEERGTYL